MTTMCGFRKQLPDFRSLDESETDYADRLLAQRRRLAEAAEAWAELRASADDAKVQARMDAIPKLLGPEPPLDDADGWAHRGIKLVEISAVDGCGINPKAAATHAIECARRAAWANPAKYGTKVTAEFNPMDTFPMPFLEAIQRMNRDDLMRYIAGQVGGAGMGRSGSPVAIEAPDPDNPD